MCIGVKHKHLWRDPWVSISAVERAHAGLMASCPCVTQLWGGHGALLASGALRASPAGSALLTKPLRDRRALYYLVVHYLSGYTLYGPGPIYAPRTAPQPSDNPLTGGTGGGSAIAAVNTSLVALPQTLLCRWGFTPIDWGNRGQASRTELAHAAPGPAPTGLARWGLPRCPAGLISLCDVAHHSAGPPTCSLLIGQPGLRRHCVPGGGPFPNPGSALLARTHSHPQPQHQHRDSRATRQARARHRLHRGLRTRWRAHACGMGRVPAAKHAVARPVWLGGRRMLRLLGPCSLLHVLGSAS
jgi:hypothetical protein